MASNRLIEPVTLLSELIQIPSVNPLGRDSFGEIYFEGRLTSRLESLLQEWGLPTERQEVHIDRDNLLTRIDGRTPVEQGGPPHALGGPPRHGAR